MKSRPQRADLLVQMTARPILAVILVLLFGVVLYQVLTSGPLVAVDKEVGAAIDAIRSPGILLVFDWVTRISSTATATALCLVMTALLWAYKRWHVLLSLWVVFAGVLLSIEGIKRLLVRARPEPVEGFIVGSYAFPSGHTSIAAAIYGFLALLLARELASRRGRTALALCAIAVVILAAFSRLYLGVHHFSDVLGGALLGGFWVLAGASFLERLGRKGLPAETKAADSDD